MTTAATIRTILLATLAAAATAQQPVRLCGGDDFNPTTAATVLARLCSVETGDSCLAAGYEFEVTDELTGAGRCHIDAIGRFTDCASSQDCGLVCRGLGGSYQEINCDSFRIVFSSRSDAFITEYCAPSSSREAMATLENHCCLASSPHDFCGEDLPVGTTTVGVGTTAPPGPRYSWLGLYFDRLPQRCMHDDTNYALRRPPFSSLVPSSS